MHTLRFAVLALLLVSPATAQTLVSKGLVAAARIPSNARDAQGETLGGFGSAMALVPGSWHRDGATYKATLAMLPDRGWNTEGTTDYQSRLQYFDLSGLGAGHAAFFINRPGRQVNGDVRCCQFNGGPHVLHL